MTFERKLSAAPKVLFNFEGDTVEASAGDSVAAALMGAGVSRIRYAPRSGAARSPYCLMGVCFECLVEIDGASNQQACMIEVKSGMDVYRQVWTGRTDL